MSTDESRTSRENDHPAHAGDSSTTKRGRSTIGIRVAARVRQAKTLRSATFSPARPPIDAHVCVRSRTARPCERRSLARVRRPVVRADREAERACHSGLSELRRRIDAALHDSEAKRAPRRDRQPTRSSVRELAAAVREAERSGLARSRRTRVRSLAPHGRAKRPRSIRSTHTCALPPLRTPAANQPAVFRSTSVSTTAMVLMRSRQHALRSH